jgi:hypothetical protein
MKIVFAILLLSVPAFGQATTEPATKPTSQPAPLVLKTGPTKSLNQILPAIAATAQADETAAPGIIANLVNSRVIGSVVVDSAVPDGNLFRVTGHIAFKGKPILSPQEKSSIEAAQKNLDEATANYNRMLSQRQNRSGAESHYQAPPVSAADSRAVSDARAALQKATEDANAAAMKRTPPQVVVGTVTMTPSLGAAMGVGGVRVGGDDGEGGEGGGVVCGVSRRS